MTTTPGDHRERLRRDVPTGIAAFLCLLALLAPTVGVVTLLVPGPQVEARGNPLYWLILMVPALWAWRVMDYSPAILRTVRPLLFAAPFLAGAVVLAASVMAKAMTPYWVMLVVTIALSVAGGLLYNRSLLAREGAGG